MLFVKKTSIVTNQTTSTLYICRCINNVAYKTSSLIGVNEAKSRIFYCKGVIFQQSSTKMKIHHVFIFFIVLLYLGLTTTMSLQLEDSTYIRLQTDAKGLYVRISNDADGKLLSDSTNAAFTNMFRVRLVPNKLNQVQLLAMNHKFVTGDLDRGGILVANRDGEPSGWETFNYTIFDNNKIQLKHSVSGKYVTAENGGGSVLIANRDSASQWETFIVQKMDRLKGVNLGSWLIPEQWMVPWFYDNSGDAHDFFTFCQKLGKAEATRRMNQFMSSYITRDDFVWLHNHGFNTVRLPIGYWNIIPDTKYNTYIDVGKSAIENCLNWAQEFNISVLIDLHGAVGSQNGQDHSGRSGPIDFDPDQTLTVIKRIVQLYGNRRNIIGIELLNEPNVDAIGVERLKQYYWNAFNIINSTRPDIMIMYHDGFKPLNYWTDFLKFPNVVVDTHRYQLYTQYEQDMTLQQHYDEATGQWYGEISSFPRNVVTGEWCASLPPKAYNGLDDQGKRLATKIYFEKQNYAWSTSLGYYYWSYKCQYTEWSLRDLVDKGILDHW
jgi:glucan 1,3-beta-glucosidase